MAHPEKITIIEGPPPTFELVHDAWLYGVSEGPEPVQVARCRLRTFNGPALVERCYRAWRDGQSISLEYRTEIGITEEAPIIAARWQETDDGHVLIVWVRLLDSDIEIELDFGDDDEDEWDGDDLLGL